MKNNLKFSGDGKFKMLLLGDPHQNCDIESKIGKAKFDDSQKLLVAALDTLKPDLVVYMGDICLDYDRNSGVEQIKPIIRKMTEPIVERGLPFAIILGNHEHDAKLEEELVKAYMELPNCLSYNEAPEITGNLNYHLTVESSKTDKPAFNLWFIDSNNKSPDKDLSVYEWVYRDQIDWYEKKADELKEQNGGEILHSIVFQHIPVTEEYDALREAKPWEFFESVRGHGMWDKHRYVGKPGMTDYLGEGPCAPSYNEGQFESWKKTGDVIGAFFGHDHLNDFTATVDGIVLGQCKTSGFHCFTDGARSCVRLITLDESDLSKLETSVHHFKEFGLKCTCLGPIKRTINDKQSIALTHLSRVAMGAAAVGAVAFAVKKIAKLKK